MKPLEKLAIAQAVYKKVGAMVSTKSSDSLRALCDAETRANYENMGVKSYEIKIDDVKVGTFSVKTAKAEKKLDIEVTDLKAYVEYCVENGFMTTDDAQVRMHFRETGEVPDGCEVVEYEKPGGYAGTVLNIDEDTVFETLGDALPAAVQPLLEGGATWES